VLLRMTKPVPDFRIPPRCKWDPHSSETLRSLVWYLRYRRFEATSWSHYQRSSSPKQTDKLSRIAGNYQATLRNVPEVRKSRKMLIMVSKHVFSNMCFNIIIPFSCALSSDWPLSMLIHRWICCAQLHVPPPHPLNLFFQGSKTSGYKIIPK